MSSDELLWPILAHDDSLLVAAVKIKGTSHSIATNAME